MRGLMKEALVYTFDKYNVAFDADSFFENEYSPSLLKIDNNHLFINLFDPERLVLMMFLVDLNKLESNTAREILEETMVLNSPHWDKNVKFSLDPDRKYIVLSKMFSPKEFKFDNIGPKLVSEIDDLLSVCSRFLKTYSINPVNIINKN